MHENVKKNKRIRVFDILLQTIKRCQIVKYSYLKVRFFFEISFQTPKFEGSIIRLYRLFDHLSNNML